MHLNGIDVAPFTDSSDQPTINRGERGDHVVRAQSSLMRAGYSLPRWGADGQFGKETAAALTAFQKANSLPVTGRFDVATLDALERAGAPSPDYAALFADGVLRGTIAIGHDEVGSHEPELAKTRRGLAQRGYVDVTAAQRRELGLPDDGRFLTRTLTRDGAPITVVLELITPEAPDAKQRFTAAMQRDELVMYGGHGRYGSGPDFDDIGSTAGNFVIGAPFEAGHVTLGANDLAKTPLPAHYQLMFFDGCNTYRYFDDLRNKTPGKTTKNLDVLGSSTELYWNVTAQNLLAMLDGVTDGADLAELNDSLNAVNRQGPTDATQYFRGDGFEDNK